MKCSRKQRSIGVAQGGSDVRHRKPEELEQSFAYATAVAWLLYEASDWQLPEQQDGDAMARLWSKVYYPQDQRAASFSPHCWRTGSLNWQAIAAVTFALLW